MNGNGKNIIIFHLESLNSLVFQLHPELFPNLRKIMEISTYYSNYYSTATSTNMVITDLFFGDSSQFEKVDSLKKVFSVKTSKPTLLEHLKNNGYYIKQFYYCYCDGDAKDLCDRLCMGSDFWLNDNPMLDEFSLEFEKSVSVNQKFAFFVHDDESHISHIHQYDRHDLSNDELYLYRFEQLDKTVGRLFSVLRSNGRLDETVVILYGDHGDDFFSHGMHDGYFHAIEPYSFITHCPLFVYNPGESNGVDTGLLSAINIYKLALSYVGLNDCKIENKFVFSRNLFSKQKLCKNSFNKSYSVTDGRYTLIVSNDGLKMYNNTIDVLNGKNLLDFFVLKNDTIRFVSKYDFYAAGHIKCFMTDRYKTELADEFSILHEQLLNYIKNIYDNALGNMIFSRIDYSNEKHNVKYSFYIRSAQQRIISLIPSSWKRWIQSKIYTN